MFLVIRLSVINSSDETVSRSVQIYTISANQHQNQYNQLIMNILEQFRLIFIISSFKAFDFG